MLSAWATARMSSSTAGRGVLASKYPATWSSTAGSSRFSAADSKVSSPETEGMSVRLRPLVVETLKLKPDVSAPAAKVSPPQPPGRGSVSDRLPPGVTWREASTSSRAFRASVAAESPVPHRAIGAEVPTSRAKVLPASTPALLKSTISPLGRGSGLLGS